MSLLDANAILRSCTGDFCRIEVTPSNLIFEQSNEIRIHSPTNRTFLTENHRPTFYRTPSMNPVPTNNTIWTIRNGYQNLPRKSMSKTRHNSISKKNLRFLLFSKERIEFHI